MIISIFYFVFSVNIFDIKIYIKVILSIFYNDFTIIFDKILDKFFYITIIMHNDGTSVKIERIIKIKIL